MQQSHAEPQKMQQMLLPPSQAFIDAQKISNSSQMQNAAALRQSQHNAVLFANQNLPSSNWQHPMMYPKQDTSNLDLIACLQNSHLPNAAPVNQHHPQQLLLDVYQ